MMVTDTYHQVLERHAAFKRFNERWVADPVFRKELSRDKSGTLERYAIDCQPEDVHSLQEADPSKPSTAMRAMWQMIVAKTVWTEHFYKKSAVPDDPRIRGWRERQIARQFLELGPFHTKSNIHASLSIEVTKGCSVGCWFCALSPDRLGGVFRYDAAGRADWIDTLKALGSCLGPAAQSGFLYWASDPFDHPNYEEMCIDFYETVGVFPPTTTALPIKDPARTRKLLKVSQERDCWINRFSILTLKMLDRVHREFSAGELARVECLPLNPESAFAFGNAGRFRERAMAEPEVLERQRRNLLWAPWYTGDPAYAETSDYPLASIGCVTGFLLNMVDRSVQLISPCAASDRWPLGYYIHDQGRFTDGADLKGLLDGMVERHMSPYLDDSDTLRLHDWLRYEETENGFRLHGRFHQSVAFEGIERRAAWHAIGDLVKNGPQSVEHVASAVASQCSIDGGLVRGMLNELLRSGVLNEICD